MALTATSEGICRIPSWSELSDQLLLAKILRADQPPAGGSSFFNQAPQRTELRVQIEQIASGFRILDPVGHEVGLVYDQNAWASIKREFVDPTVGEGEESPETRLLDDLIETIGAYAYEIGRSAILLEMHNASEVVRHHLWKRTRHLSIDSASQMDTMYHIPLNTTRESIRFWNHLAYDLLATEYRWRGILLPQSQATPQYRTRLLVEHINTPPSQSTVVELGPGTGEILDALSEFGYKTIGIEISGRMIEIARDTSPASDFIQEDVFACDLTEQSVSAIYAAAFFHLFPKREVPGLLRRISQWLKEDGVFYIDTTVSSASSEGYSLKRDFETPVLRYRSLWTEPEFTTLLEESNLEIVETHTIEQPDRDKNWQGYICKPIQSK